MGTKLKKMKLIFHMLDRPDVDDDDDDFLEQWNLDDLAEKAKKVLEEEFTGLEVLYFEYENET